jgi:hypothetical protein
MQNCGAVQGQGARPCGGQQLGGLGRFAGRLGDGQQVQGTLAEFHL